MTGEARGFILPMPMPVPGIVFSIKKLPREYALRIPMFLQRLQPFYLALTSKTQPNWPRASAVLKIGVLRPIWSAHDFD